MLLQTGALVKGKEQVEAANASAEHLLRESQSRVATTLKYLGAIQSLEGDLAAAEASFVRAIELSENAVGKEDPETAKHIGNLASLYLRRGEIESAMPLFERCLRIWETQEKPHPVYYSGAITNLAVAKLQTGESDAGLALFERAYSIQKTAFDEKDIRLQNFLRRYIEALESVGQKEQAEQLKGNLIEQ